jgi:hypothetical protein
VQSWETRLIEELKWQVLNLNLKKICFFFRVSFGVLQGDGKSSGRAATNVRADDSRRFDGAGFQRSGLSGLSGLADAATPNLGGVHRPARATMRAQ